MPLARISLTLPLYSSLSYSADRLDHIPCPYRALVDKF